MNVPGPPTPMYDLCKNNFASAESFSLCIFMPLNSKMKFCYFFKWSKNNKIGCVLTAISCSTTYINDIFFCSGSCSSLAVLCLGPSERIVSTLWSVARAMLVVGNSNLVYKYLIYMSSSALNFKKILRPVLLRQGHKVVQVEPTPLCSTIGPFVLTLRKKGK